MGLFSGIYNPCDEPSNSEQIVAARWELLRRNKTFQQVARQWIESREFRLKHVHTPEYHNQRIHYPRCALDWIITPAERVEVLRAQEETNHIFSDLRYIFGPVRCKHVVSDFETIKCRGRGCLRIEPVRSHILLRLDDNWRDAPAFFKRQFRFAIKGDFQFLELKAQMKKLGIFLEWAAHRLAKGAGKAQFKEIADQMWNLGSECSEIGEFYRVFALPDATYTPAGLKQSFDRIRKSFAAAGQFDQRAKFNRTKSFLGTAEDWRWFLAAEARGLDWTKSKDVYRLAESYTEDLKPRPGKPNRANVKAYGGQGQRTKSTAVKNRRNTIVAHCESIKRWIEKQYPPQ
jgi:hypothetical protein